MKLQQKHIDKIKNYFRNQPVLKAYLFGSFVKGNATKNSDIDILVELDYSQEIGLGFIKMKLDLENLLQKNIDLVSSRGLSKYIQPLVEKQKQLIYERKRRR